MAASHPRRAVRASAAGEFGRPVKKLVGTVIFVIFDRSADSSVRPYGLTCATFPTLGASCAVV